MHIRDPIHGSVEITPEERTIIDSRFYQRLRHIKQLGFADLAFPGATHSRYSHGIGAMHVASRLFDALFRERRLAPEERARLRQTLRLAVLLHDLGHAPLSHATERMLPARSALGLPGWTGEGEGSRATHEDMTLMLILTSDLARLIERAFAALGILPEHVASLICGRGPSASTAFVVDGVDHAPLLRQVVSSELDADRMDYLIRDSFYTGVNYGRYDFDWLIQNVAPVEQQGQLILGISHKAVLAFEDFLLSRYHMFVSVYYHNTCINFERMLARFFTEASDEYRLEASAEEYIQADDIQLIATLRQSRNRWARRIVERRGYALLLEANPFEPEPELGPLLEGLDSAGIDHFETESRGVLSKYFGSSHPTTPFVVRTARGALQRIEEYTPLFERYAKSARIRRVYVDPDRRNDARILATSLGLDGAERA
jgi:HD superfamily phosphohydrolase